MRVLILMALAALPAQADMIATCDNGPMRDKGPCETIDLELQELMSLILPAGLAATEVTQFANQLYFQVRSTEALTGREGNLSTAAICNLPKLRALLDGDYTMSVRMTYYQGEITYLDEIAFIEDCEAN